MVMSYSDSLLSTPRKIGGFEEIGHLFTDRRNGPFSIESTEPENDDYLEIIGVLKDFSDALDQFAKYCPKQEFYQHPTVWLDDQNGGFLIKLHGEMGSLWEVVQPYLRSTRGMEYSPKKNWGGDQAPDPAKLREMLDLARKRTEALRGTYGMNNSETNTSPPKVKAWMAADHSRFVRNRPTMKGFSEQSYRKPRTLRRRSFEVGNRTKGLGGKDELKNSKLISLPEIAKKLANKGLKVSTKNWAKRMGFPTPIESNSKTRFYTLSEVTVWMEQKHPNWVEFLHDDDEKKLG